MVAGNIGTPLIACADQSSDKSITVAEVSSFQLELIDSFRPDVAVLLNLTPDHLDRHASFEDYARAKARIFENQTERDAAVLNADDLAATQYAPARPQIFWFSREKRVASGAYLRGDQIVFRRDGEEVALAAPLRHRAARRTQSRKCSGRRVRRIPCGRRARRDRRGRAQLSRASSIGWSSWPKSAA